MIRLQSGTVIEVTEEGPALSRCTVRWPDGTTRPALAYHRFLVAPPRPGDTVVINTAALDMQLGTGGVDFVVSCAPGDPFHGEAKPGPTGEELRHAGHVMKLRYSPLQVPVMSAEAPESPHHDRLRNATHAQGMVVIAAELHSQAVVAARALQRLTQKHDDGLRVSYLWPPGGALVADFSRQLADLRESGAIAGAITCGEALGGDIEAINIHSGLLAARHVLKSNICIAAIGPGVVGTGTPFGTTALVQGDVLNAALDLGATAIAIPRISFSDDRARHRGLSHHTLTVLGRMVHRSVTVALPRLAGAPGEELERQLITARLGNRHRLEYYEVEGVRALAERLPRVTTMGRTYDDDPAFFEAAAAGAAGALAILHEGPE